MGNTPFCFLLLFLNMASLRGRHLLSCCFEHFILGFHTLCLSFGTGKLWAATGAVSYAHPVLVEQMGTPPKENSAFHTLPTATSPRANRPKDLGPSNLGSGSPFHGFKYHPAPTKSHASIRLLGAYFPEPQFGCDDFFLEGTRLKMRGFVLVVH